jgi:hypothetical protein
MTPEEESLSQTHPHEKSPLRQPDTESAEPKRSKVERLLDGDFRAVQEAVEVLILNRQSDWEAVARGEEPLDSLVYENEKTRIGLSAEAIMDAVRFVYAVVEGKYPGFKYFKGDPQGDIAKMALKLQDWTLALGTIVMCHDDSYPNDPWS